MSQYSNKVRKKVCITDSTGLKRTHLGPGRISRYKINKLTAKRHALSEITSIMTARDAIVCTEVYSRIIYITRSFLTKDAAFLILPGLEVPERVC